MSLCLLKPEHKPQLKEEEGEKPQDYLYNLNSHLRLRVLASKEL